MAGLGFDARRLSEILLAPPGERPTASLYLVPDPGNAVTTDVRLRDLVKEGETAIRNEKDLSPSERDRARAALDRAAGTIGSEVKNRLDGTWITFSDASGTETFHVPCVLKTRVAIGPQPYVAPLAALIEQADRYGILITDHRETKIYSYFLGGLEEIRTFRDPSQQNNAWAGWLGRDQLKANHHREVVLHRHLQHVADAFFALHKKSPFDRIVIAAHPPATLAKLERALHPYLTARIVARESWEHGTSAEDLRKHLASISERIEIEKERNLISRVRDHISGDMQAATGADATLSALWAGRVATLLVPEGVKLAGLRCEGCHFLAAENGQARRDAARCRECGGPTRRVDDLVEEASELAVLTGSKVRLIGRARAELESLGGVAALLRYV